jgi:hypothetical protein
VARLPFALRLQVNLKLRDHVPSRLIVAWLHQEHLATLKEIGIETFNLQNISTWRLSGFKKWEAQQERLEEMSAQREIAIQIAQRGDGSLQAANLVMVASQVNEALQEFDLEELKKKLKEKPEFYAILVEAVSKLSRAGIGERKLQLEFTKYQDKVAEQKRKLEEQLGKAKEWGLTPETIAKMEEALNLL